MITIRSVLSAFHLWLVVGSLAQVVHARAVRNLCNLRITSP